MTRTHVVTGAGAGIGHALALQLAERGDRLVLPVRNADRAAQVDGAHPLDDATTMALRTGQVTAVRRDVVQLAGDHMRRFGSAGRAA